MIPWDTFKTPQDAYEYGKANARFFTPIRQNEITLTFSTLYIKNWPWEPAWRLALEVRR